MHKKLPLWLVTLAIIFTFLISGFLVRQELKGTTKFGIISKSALFLATVPANVKYLLSDYRKNPLRAETHSNFDKETIIKLDKLKKYNSLLLLSRWDGDKKMNIVDLYEVDKFKLIKTFTIDLKKIYRSIDLSENDYKKLDFKRMRIFHPYMKKNGNIVFNTSNSRLIEIDKCGKLFKYTPHSHGLFHHSVSASSDETYYWLPIILTKHNKEIKKKISKDYKFTMNGIVKLDKDFNILFKKSIYEILLDNNLIGDGFFSRKDIDHINDIEIANFSGKFFLKDDIFLSFRGFNKIIHYRPSTNKVIKVIVGPFSMQHDVDIISENEISIFNNNNYVKSNNYSNILIYNFETRNFDNIFKDQLKNIKFKTRSEGLSDHIKDKSFMIEETNQGRLIIINKNKEIELQFLNLKKNNRLFYLNWSRVINDDNKIEGLKKIFNSEICD